MLFIKPHDDIVASYCICIIAFYYDIFQLAKLNEAQLIYIVGHNGLVLIHKVTSLMS